jgi:hypothetical protein
MVTAKIMIYEIQRRLIFRTPEIEDGFVAPLI